MTPTAALAAVGFENEKPEKVAESRIVGYTE
jgi:hypothetical protein